MKVIPKRTFLVRQDEIEGGKKKDVIAIAGKPFDFTDREAIKFWGILKIEDKDKKRLISIAKTNGITRVV